MKGKLFLLAVIFLLPSVFATTYYLQITNPNDYDLTNFQIKVNVTQYNISIPIAQITTLDGFNIPFCYEQPNGECNETYENATGIVWLKVPYLPKKDYIVIKVIVNGTNGAVNGTEIFDLYDDFNDGTLNTTLWSVRKTAGGSVTEANGTLRLEKLSDGTLDIDYAYVDCKLQNFPHPSVFEVKFKPVSAYESAISPIWSLTFQMAIGKYDWNTGTLYYAVAQRYEGYDTFTYTYYDGSTWNKETVYWSASTGNWYVYETVFMGNEINVLYKDADGNILVSKTVPNIYFEPNRLYGIGVSEIGGNFASSVVSLVDWIRVRKYADQDPTILPAYSQSSFTTGSSLQTSAEHSQIYQYVRQVTVLPENSVSISNTQIIIELDTKSLIADGKLQTDCSDIYITYYDPLYGEVPAKFWVDPTTCNTNATRIYVKLPTISVNDDWIMNIYYGSPEAVPVWDPKNTFTFYVDLANPSDISQNLIIRTEGTASLDYTSNGLVVQTGSDGKVLIVNK